MKSEPEPRINLSMAISNVPEWSSSRCDNPKCYRPKMRADHEFIVRDDRMPDRSDVVGSKCSCTNFDCVRINIAALNKMIKRIRRKSDGK